MQHILLPSLVDNRVRRLCLAFWSSLRSDIYGGSRLLLFMQHTKTIISFISGVVVCHQFNDMVVLLPISLRSELYVTVAVHSFLRRINRFMMKLLCSS